MVPTPVRRPSRKGTARRRPGGDEVHAVVDDERYRAQGHDADEVPDEEGLEVVVGVLCDGHHEGVLADALPEPAGQFVVVAQQVEEEHQHQEHPDADEEHEASGGRDPAERPGQQVPELLVEHLLWVLPYPLEEGLWTGLRQVDVRLQQRPVLLQLRVREDVADLLERGPRRVADDEQHREQHHQQGGRDRDVGVLGSVLQPGVHLPHRVVHPDGEDERPEHRLDHSDEEEDQGENDEDPADGAPRLLSREVHGSNWVYRWKSVGAVTRRGPEVQVRERDQPGPCRTPSACSQASVPCATKWAARRNATSAATWSSS